MLEVDVKISTLPVGDGVLSRLTDASRELLLGADPGVRPSLPPPCSERGGRINMIQLRKKNAKLSIGTRNCVFGMYGRNWPTRSTRVAVPV